MRTFSAWTDEQGFNVDREHHMCDAPVRCLGLERERDCHHIYLFDLERDGSYKAVVRVLFRGRPFYLRVLLGRKYRTVFRLGRRRDW